MIFVALVLGHVVGDFVLQNDAKVYVKRHGDTRARLRAIGSHAGVVALTMLMLALLGGGDVNFGPGSQAVPIDARLIFLVVMIGALHGLQDLAKESWLSPETSSRPTWLLLDQGVHVLVIGVLVVLTGLLHPSPALPDWLLSLRKPSVFEAAILMVLGTWAAGIFLREALAKFHQRAFGSHTDGASEAGSFWIGMVERVIVLMAVTFGGTQGFAAVGLVVAAKSVFRWREIEEDPKKVEYFLLGSLGSVTIAACVGLALARLLGGPHITH